MMCHMRSGTWVCIPNKISITLRCQRRDRSVTGTITCISCMLYNIPDDIGNCSSSCGGTGGAGRSQRSSGWWSQLSLGLICDIGLPSLAFRCLIDSLSILNSKVLDVVILHSIHLYFTLIRFFIFKLTSYQFSGSFRLHSALVWHLFHFVMMWLMWLASCLPVFTWSAQSPASLLWASLVTYSGLQSRPELIQTLASRPQSFTNYRQGRYKKNGQHMIFWPS